MRIADTLWLLGNGSTEKCRLETLERFLDDCAETWDWVLCSDFTVPSKATLLRAFHAFSVLNLHGMGSSEDEMLEAHTSIAALLAEAGYKRG